MTPYIIAWRNYQAALLAYNLPHGPNAEARLYEALANAERVYRGLLLHIR